MGIITWIRKRIKHALGIFREDSPASMTRIMAIVLTLDGCWTVHSMLRDGRNGLEVAAVATAYFTAAAALKTISKKFEGPEQ